MKKFAPLLAIGSLALGLVSCSGSSSSDSYVAPKPVTVSFYDDNPTSPSLVGYGYCIAGSGVDLRLSSDYDFLSRDEERQAGLRNGEYLAFEGWKGSYESDGQPVDLSSVKEDCSVYASFLTDVYEVGFRYYNGTNLIRDEASEFPSAIESSIEWGSFAGDFAIDYSTLEHDPVSAEYGREYTCEGFTVRGYPGSGTFRNFEELASSLSLEPFIDGRGQRDYRLYVVDPSLADGRHELGLLSESLVIDLDAVYSEETAAHLVRIAYGDTTVETEVLHGSALPVATSIVGGSYTLVIGDPASPLLEAAAPIEANEGRELSYEAVYAAGAAPHLAGNAADLAAVYGPLDIHVGLMEASHCLNIYDSDLSAELIVSLTLPAGTRVEASVALSGSNYAFKVSCPDGDVGYDLPAAGIEAIEVALRKTPLASSLYGTVGLEETEDGAFSFPLTADSDVYCAVEGDYELIVGYVDGDLTYAQSIGTCLADTRLMTANPYLDKGSDVPTYVYAYQCGFHDGSLSLGASDFTWGREVDESLKEVRYILRAA